MITLITSLYRSEKFLPAYIKDVEAFHKASEGITLELIIVANDITEKEKELLSSLSKHEWIRVIEVPRENLYASWNRGVREAKGEYIGFWNVDDQRFPDALIAASEEFKKGAELVYFPFLYKRYVSIAGIDILAKKKIIDPPLFNKESFRHGMHAGPFFLFKKELFDKNGPFDESFKIAGDFD